MLTAIVIGFGLVAFATVLVSRLREVRASDELIDLAEEGDDAP